MKRPIVIDTNVFISALLNPFGNSATVLELCFQRQYEPLMGTTLYLEYEDVINRNELFENCLLNEDERQNALDDFLSICKWIKLYYTWRPNLRDEGDNHLIELAVAGGANTIVTGNIKDFQKPELNFPEVSILTPKQLMEVK
jgi:putative PIN family toxin of toxin-antitoxin system